MSSAGKARAPVLVINGNGISQVGCRGIYSDRKPDGASQPYAAPSQVSESWRTTRSFWRGVRLHRWPKALEKLACSQRTLQELQRGCQDCFAALSGPITGEEGRLMWISFIRLLRAILENAHLVPHGPTPSLSSCPLLGACVWEGLGSGHKSLGFTHSQNSLLPWNRVNFTFFFFFFKRVICYAWVGCQTSPECGNYSHFILSGISYKTFRRKTGGSSFWSAFAFRFLRPVGGST